MAGLGGRAWLPSSHSKRSTLWKGPEHMSNRPAEVKAVLSTGAGTSSVPTTQQNTNGPPEGELLTNNGVNRKLTTRVAECRPGVWTVPLHLLRGRAGQPAAPESGQWWPGDCGAGGRLGSSKDLLGDRHNAERTRCFPGYTHASKLIRWQRFKYVWHVVGQRYLNKAILKNKIKIKLFLKIKLIVKKKKKELCLLLNILPQTCTNITKFYDYFKVKKRIRGIKQGQDLRIARLLPLRSSLLFHKVAG